MKKLNEKKWQRFSMNNVFNIGHGFYNKKPPMSPNGTVPFVGASGINNGITGFCTMQVVRDNSKVGYGPNEPIKRKLFERGSICVVNNGSAIGYSYYQPKQFTCTHDVNPLTLRNHEVSEDEALFLSQMIRKQGVCFIYSRKWRPSRMVRSQFLLPVDDGSNPDYDYMAQYASEMRRSMLMRYKNFIAGQLSQLEHKDIPALGEKEWGEFVLGDIFTVDAGKRLETRNKVEGNRPFIGATDNGNGVTGFVGNDNTSKDSNVLGVNYNGAPCIAFYHPYECIFTDDVKRLHLKNHIDDKYVLLFFTSIFAMQRVKYSYGYKFKEKRMQRQKLMLPVSDDGKPDYEYMEQYAKNMMLRKYEQYLAFIDRQSAAEEVNI